MKKSDSNLRSIIGKKTENKTQTDARASRFCSAHRSSLVFFLFEIETVKTQQKRIKFINSIIILTPFSGRFIRQIREGGGVIASVLPLGFFFRFAFV